MRLHENKHVSFFLSVLYLILFAGAGYLFFKTLFPLLLPLLVQLILPDRKLVVVNLHDGLLFRFFHKIQAAPLPRSPHF